MPWNHPMAQSHRMDNQNHEDTIHHTTCQIQLEVS